MVEHTHTHTRPNEIPKLLYADILFCGFDQSEPGCYIKFHVRYSVLIMHTSKRGVAKPNKIFQYVCYDMGHPHLECSCSVP